ncbi:glutathione S-transferase family protein [Hydrogenophaga sp. BPS33]|uniref:glutathione S-transferase family protein n=1 Tax=Hydrogenophaga sp. BPS33 TaxID=2651974 RepID=UPI00131FED53|nr:glutathione S-transferase family protein [Hydrogenophaga sp. BPS33]QHE83595.1 glutathione S-transferase family protein [Hydrogenophaga sp. BPS33]
MLELYNAPISTCSQKVRMSLAEKQLDWVDHRLIFSNFDQLKPEYLKLNPNGVVPTLVHDGGVVVDSSVINEYLEDVFPERPLRPSNKVELAHMRAWRQYIDEVPTPSIRYPSFNAYFVMKYSGYTDEQFREHAERLPVRRDFYLQMGRTGFPQEEVDAAVRRLRDTLERMERALEKTEWLAHDSFTLADISVMPSIVRMEDLSLQGQWKDLPRVTDWYRRLQARPAFATTYYPGTRDLGPTC